MMSDYDVDDDDDDYNAEDEDKDDHDTYDVNYEDLVTTVMMMMM